MKRKLMALFAVLLLISTTGCSFTNNEDGILLKGENSSLTSSEFEVIRQEEMRISLKKAISEMEQVGKCELTIKGDSALVDIKLADGFNLTDEDEENIKSLVSTSYNMSEEAVTIIINE